MNICVLEDDMRAKMAFEMRLSFRIKRNSKKYPKEEKVIYAIAYALDIGE